MCTDIKILIILFMRAQDEYRARLNSALLNSPLRSWAKILPHRPHSCQVKIAKFHKKNFFLAYPEMVKSLMKNGEGIYVKKIKNVIS